MISASPAEPLPVSVSPQADSAGTAICGIVRLFRIDDPTAVSVRRAAFRWEDDFVN
jgi:hypothetical protein